MSAEKIDNIPFQKKITIRPTPNISGSSQAVLYTANGCYEILYQENQQEIFLRKGLWNLGGFAYGYLY